MSDDINNLIVTDRQSSINLIPQGVSPSLKLYVQDEQLSVLVLEDVTKVTIAGDEQIRLDKGNLGIQGARGIAPELSDYVPYSNENIRELFLITVPRLFFYDGDGDLDYIEYSNGVVKSFNYDIDKNLESITFTNGLYTYTKNLIFDINEELIEITFT